MKTINKITLTAIIAAIAIFTTLPSCKKEATDSFTLTTKVPTRVAGTSIRSGGILNKAESAKIVQTGVCWSKTADVVKGTNNFTTSPSSKDSFTTDVDGLEPNTTYYLKAFVEETGGAITYGNEIKFNTTLNVGAKMFGGEVVYVFEPGDLGYVEGELHGFVIALKEEAFGLEWGCSGTYFTGASGTAIGTGKANTAAIIQNCTSPNIAAKVCSDLVSGTYSDWFLPSIGELEKIDANIKNLSSINQNGGNFLSSSQTGKTTFYKLFVYPNQAFRDENGSKSTKNYYHTIACRYF